MTKTLALLVITTVAALAATSAASADGPVFQTQTASAANVPWGPRCGSEPILASFTVTRRIQSYYDDGQLVLQRRHVTGAGTITLASTGTSLPYEVDFTITTDVASRTATIAGQQAHVLLPGGGIVFQNSGRLIQNIATLPPAILDEAGPHDYFDPNGTERVCAALGA
jgi:hypothetical protein